ncbi:MAG: transcriptional regulator NrdR [Planctomycetaceae bacterium]|nr:transcriptional regulator NrdR [Planctomycetaceae bacterium]
MAVQCPFCQVDNDKVIDSRASDAGKVIRRRRECLGCGRRFTTYERVEELSRLTVIKRDGSRVPFNRENILRGIQNACGKRPISEDAKVQLVADIEEQVNREYEREVPSERIGHLVCERLKNLDEVAYIRFASVYRRFETAGELVAELKQLSERVKDVKDQQRMF